MRSSILAASKSYFTVASWFAKETCASLTPFTFSSADCTAVAQEPHVMPLISSVTDSSLASALGEKTSTLVSTTKAAKNDLRCISHTPTRDYITTPLRHPAQRTSMLAPVSH